MRLLPYVLLLYVIAYLDRNNLATAALQMPRDLGFDDRVIGFGAGIFALGLHHSGNPRHHDHRALERAALDCPHHGFLGDRHHRDGLYPHPAPVLHHAFLAGIGGGRIFPRDHRLSHPLVRLRRSRQGGRRFHGGHSLSLRGRFPGLGIAAGRPLGHSARLAVVVHSGGPARAVLRGDDLVLSDRLAASGKVVASGRARVGDQSTGEREAGQKIRPRLYRVAGACGIATS